MPDLWTRDVALLVFVWLIAHHYQQWYVVATMQKMEPQPQKVTRQAKKEKGEFEECRADSNCP